MQGTWRLARQFEKNVATYIFPTPNEIHNEMKDFVEREFDTKTKGDITECKMFLCFQQQDPEDQAVEQDPALPPAIKQESVDSSANDALIEAKGKKKASEKNVRKYQASKLKKRVSVSRQQSILSTEDNFEEGNVTDVEWEEVYERFSTSPSPIKPVESSFGRTIQVTKKAAESSGWQPKSRSDLVGIKAESPSPSICCDMSLDLQL